MLRGGVDSAPVTLEAAAWQEGRALRLGTFEQTAAGWAARRDAVAALRVSPTGSGRDPGTGTDPQPVASVLEPTGGGAPARAPWARAPDALRGRRPPPPRPPGPARPP